jgi:hypothetical protein
MQAQVFSVLQKKRVMTAQVMARRVTSTNVAYAESVNE